MRQAFGLQWLFALRGPTPCYGEEKQALAYLTMKPVDQPARGPWCCATTAVTRRLLNADDFARWARSEGFAVLRPSAWHLTVVRYPDGARRIDLDASDLRVEAHLARYVARMSGVIALCFGSRELSSRHEAHLAAGGRWDFLTYRPHVTFTPDDGRDVRQVRPFDGPLLFGPEIIDHGAI